MRHNNVVAPTRSPGQMQRLIVMLLALSVLSIFLVSRERSIVDTAHQWRCI
jgi:hypothetical protein